jgi:FKBP-type peptidyl-prolyl cis-trans isomerase SlyD
MQDKQHITRHKVITMQYSLTTARGIVMREATASAVKYLHGAGILFPKLEQALERHIVGDIVKVKLLPDDAFGRRDSELTCQFRMNEFPPGEIIEIGASIVGRDDEGEEISFTVTDISDGVARLDANHPLAGQTLVFEIEIQGIRDASGEEISRGEVLE